MSSYEVYEAKRFKFRNHSKEFLEYSKFSITQDNYERLYIEPMPFEKMDIGKLLKERIKPIMTEKKMPVQGIVVTICIDGVMDSYFIDKWDQGVYLPDFMPMGKDDGMFTGREGLRLEKINGTFKAVESRIIDMKKYYLLTAEQHRENINDYIVDDCMNIVMKGADLEFGEKIIGSIRSKVREKELKSKSRRVIKYGLGYQKINNEKYQKTERPKKTGFKAENERVSIIGRLRFNEEQIKNPMQEKKEKK